MSTDLDARVASSLDLMKEFLDEGLRRAPVDVRLLQMAYEGVSTFSLGGKHLRSRLVHISAGADGPCGRPGRVR